MSSAAPSPHAPAGSHRGSGFSRPPMITVGDMVKLSDMLTYLSAHAGSPEGTAILELKRKLRQANVVPFQAIGRDVITMRSGAELEDPDTREVIERWLVYPPEAKAQERRISVLEPLGIAMLGRAAGDVIAWDDGAGRHTALIRRVSYQPERCGDYHL